MKCSAITKSFFSFAFALLVTACDSTHSVKNSIRLAHNLDIQHPVHKSLLYMNDVLVDLSKGKMQIVIYPSGQLGSEREIIELIQIGSLGMTKVSASSLEAFIPEMKLFSIPYLFSDNTHYWDVLNSDIGRDILNAGVNARIRGLGYFDAGSRSFYTTQKRVTQPSDLEGLKIRVMNSQSAVDMVNLMGGSATPVSWGELYTSLQQGIVEAAENNPPSFYYSKHYEVSKYFTLDEHTSIPDVIIIGTHFWDNLSQQEQVWLMQAMDQATAFQRQLWEESTTMSLQEVAKAGVEIIKPDKTLFKEGVKLIYEELKGTYLDTLVTNIQMKERDK
jgi:tripartite ATP-independent transporter DctP family solute receptor